MGIGLNSDSDYASRTGGPASTGLITATYWTWHLRSSGVGYAAVSESNIVSQEGNAGRFSSTGFDNTFIAGTETDGRLALSDNGGQTDFASSPSRADGYVDDEPPFDLWVFYVMVLGGTAGAQTITTYWSLDNVTWHTQTRSGATENSITAATVLIGRGIAADANTSQGYYAYAGCRAVAESEANAKALITRTAFASGDWAYWRLANNSDTADTSGNSRTLTFNGTMTSEGDPTIPGGGAATSRPLFRRVLRFFRQRF